VKALPLWQPWASLVGAKRIAVGVAKRMPGGAVQPLRQRSRRAAARRDHRDGRPRPLRRDHLREGARARARNWHEFAFGNYEPGRFAWVLRDVEQLAAPIPFTGRQGIFDVPDRLLNVDPAQGALL
jgi:hypothetical protein